MESYGYYRAHFKNIDLYIPSPKNVSLVAIYLISHLGKLQLQANSTRVDTPVISKPDISIEAVKGA